MSVYVMQMGQFIDHDFAHSPNFPQQTCCDENIENRDEQCIPIDIPSDDPFFSNIINPDTNLPEPVTCMRMARAMTSPDLDCPMDIERQQVTTYSTNTLGYINSVHIHWVISILYKYPLNQKFLFFSYFAPNVCKRVGK